MSSKRKLEVLRKTKAERENEQAIAKQRKQIVDEFGRLDQELSPVKSKQRRFEELGKLIRSWHASAEPEAAVSSAGDRFKVVLGPRGMQTRLTDMAEVYRILGHAKYLEHTSITLKALEESDVDSAVVASLTIKERTGTRSLVIRTL